MLDDLATDPRVTPKPHPSRVELRPRVLKSLPVIKARDLGKLEAALNATSQRAVAQWIAFLSLWGYLFFSALSITDRDLILLTPIKLPLIAVDLGLEAFFWAGPPLFWVFHLYLVRKVVLLSKDIAYHRHQIRSQIELEADREPLYRRMDAFFLTRLIGHSGQGNSLRLLDGMISVVTLAAAPLALMLAYQIRFLAFHSEAATWWHRGWLLADLALVGFLATRALRARVGAGQPVDINVTELRGFCYGIGRAMAMAVSAAVIVTSLFILTVPDEAVSRFVQVPGLDGWLPRNLAPTDPDFVNDEKLDKVQWTLDLRNRDLRNAKLSGADLRKVRLDGARLSNAKLDGAQLQGASLQEARMLGASLIDADLQGATLKRANLSGAKLSWARLAGVSLEAATLPGATLNWAHLPGATLDYANLQGAVLEGARLSGASLEKASLQGASLAGAWLQGASLNSAELQGAVLEGSRLQGASLNGAKLWRSRLSQLTLNYMTGISIFWNGWRQPPFVPYTPEEVQRLIDVWSEAVPSDLKGAGGERRLAALLNMPPEDERQLQERWDTVIGISASTSRTDTLTSLACKAEDGPFVTKGIVQRVRADAFRSNVDFVRFAKSLLQPNCDGAKDLSADERAALRRMADNSW